VTTHIVDTLSLGTIVQIRESLLKAAARGERVFRFESGDPSFSVAPHVAAAMCEAATSGKTHYVPNAGIPELRQAFSTKARLENGIQARSDEVFITHGAMHGLFATFQALLDEGDEVIIPDPMWTEIAENIQFARGRAVRVPLRRATGYCYEPVEIERRITPRTKAIFVNTPHNPTGAMLDAHTLGKIVDIAKHHDLWVVSDEAYEHVTYRAESPLQNLHHSIASLAGDWAPRVISIFSFSKSHAMSGLRVGAVLVHDAQLQLRMQKILRCSINGVSSVAQWGAVAALKGSQEHHQAMREEYDVRRQRMVGALSNIPGVHVFDPQGTFFAWVEVERDLLDSLGLDTVDELSERLCERGIGNTPGSAFGPESANSMRFSFSCETSMVEEGITVLRETLLGRMPACSP
jgi:aspartate aminotransferase